MITSANPQHTHLVAQLNNFTAQKPNRINLNMCRTSVLTVGFLGLCATQFLGGTTLAPILTIAAVAAWCLIMIESTVSTNSWVIEHISWANADNTMKDLETQLVATDPSLAVVFQQLYAEFGNSAKINHYITVLSAYRHINYVSVQNKHDECPN